MTLLETYRDGSEAQRQVLNEIQTCDAKIYIAETMKKKTAARLARKIEAFRTEYNVQRHARWLARTFCLAIGRGFSLSLSFVQWCHGW